MTDKELMREMLEFLEGGDFAYPTKLATDLREALAEQPAQQGCMRCNTPKKCALYGCSPLTWPSEQPAQQEPVAWMQNTTAGLYVIDHYDEWHCIPLYTSPQPCLTCEALARTVMLDQTSHDAQRKPLTEEEILDCWKQAYEPGRREHDNAARMARAIEAAHGIGEKNG